MRRYSIPSENWQRYEMSEKLNVEGLKRIADEVRVMESTGHTVCFFYDLKKCDALSYCQAAYNLDDGEWHFFGVFVEGQEEEIKEAILKAANEPQRTELPERFKELVVKTGYKRGANKYNLSIFELLAFLRRELKDDSLVIDRERGMSFITVEIKR